jgi:hypothetical protein
MSEANGQVYSSPWIGDGYDEVATIPAHPGKWPEVQLHYRCISADEESEIREKAKRFNAKSPVRHFAELFATKISSWSLTDRHGKQLPVTADVIAALSPQFYDVLHGYLDGTMPSDVMRESLEAELKNS